MAPIFRPISRFGALRVILSPMKTPATQRSTSWIAFEQPNPTVYMPPLSDKTRDISAAQETLKVAADPIHNTPATRPSRQEVSSSTKASRTTSFSNLRQQVRGGHNSCFSSMTKCNPTYVPLEDTYLPNLRVKLPGQPMTWGMGEEDHMPPGPDVDKMLGAWTARIMQLPDDAAKTQKKAQRVYTRRVAVDEGRITLKELKTKRRKAGGAYQKTVVAKESSGGRAGAAGA